MERYYMRMPKSELSSSSPSESSKQNDLPDLIEDPGLRPQISDYNLTIRDQVRRAYLLKGPCQTRIHNFPQRKIGRTLERFNPSWFDEFGNWLEYSISKDAAFCLCCYLFRPEMVDQGGGESFVGEGFTNWKKKESLRNHEGCVIIRAHDLAWRKCQLLLNQKEHDATMFSKLSDEAKNYYVVLLTALVSCIQYLLRQGIPFLGCNESDALDEFEDSNNERVILDLLMLLSDFNVDIKAVLLKNAPENLKLTALETQKDIVRAAAIETTNAIIRDLGDGLFSLLLDQFLDSEGDVQMIVALRYVDRRGYLVERLLGIEHVTDIGALSRKKVIDDLFSIHGLSISRLCGQCYDVASELIGCDFDKLKTLIMKENECAYYVHCFAQQLQLDLVELAMHHVDTYKLLRLVPKVVNVLGTPCKSRDIIWEKQVAEVIQALTNGEITSEQVLNQESTFIHASDTCWGSYYGTLLSLISVFPMVIDLLDVVVNDGSNSEQRGGAYHLLDRMLSFEFVFILHLMRSILGATNDLSRALQRKDQDIVNAMGLVQVSRQQLQMLRDSGWSSLMDEVSSFCGTNYIDVPNMDDKYATRASLRGQEMTNSHYYHDKLFYAVIDKQLQELSNRFDKVNTELLLCVACLNPSDSFAAFDKKRLIQFAQFYPSHFSPAELLVLSSQLENFIIDMRSSIEFSDLKGISDLAQKMVETRKHEVYLLVYRLITLALILPVVTATVERAFSSMKIGKDRIRNQKCDKWITDSLVVYIEEDIFRSIPNEAIMLRVQNMESLQGLTLPLPEGQLI